MRVLTGILEAAVWLVRGNLYEVVLVLRDVDAQTQTLHAMYVRAHTNDGAKVTAYRIASKQFKGYAIAVKLCYIA